MKTKLFVLFMVSLIAGCSTNYDAKGFTGGYSHTQLAPAIFKVTFDGNAYTNRERAEDFTLLRSAELTLENGFKYFVILDSKNYQETSTYTTPTYVNTTTTVNANMYTATANSNSTITGGNTYNISKPSTSNLILCLNEKPTDIFSYDADFIKRSLKQKYGITEKP